MRIFSTLLNCLALLLTSYSLPSTSLFLSPPPKLPLLLPLPIPMSPSPPPTLPLLPPTFLYFFATSFYFSYSANITNQPKLGCLHMVHSHNELSREVVNYKPFWILVININKTWALGYSPMWRYGDERTTGWYKNLEILTFFSLNILTKSWHFRKNLDNFRFKILIYDEQGCYL